MAVETPTGEPLRAYDLALRQRDRLKALATLAELVDGHEGSLGAVEGFVQLLKDASDAAAEILEAIHSEKEDRHG
ncbi:MAG: hypothetical protein ACR652_10145 [Methylocystis sp.]|uniref:hypothetical protein n=1 Tax=Methylocystis sp. TaxID=1911079 RepID=UPI003DA3CC17